MLQVNLVAYMILQEMGSCPVASPSMKKKKKSKNSLRMGQFNFERGFIDFFQSK